MEKEKFKLRISIRKNLEDRHFEDVELDLTTFKESFRIKELEVFDREAYLTFSLEKLEDDIEK